MRPAFSIAIRFLFSSKGQTILIALGIAIGISVQIFIGSLISGLQDSLVDTTIGRSSHITISSQKKNTPLDNSADLENELKTNLPQGSFISPNISSGAFLLIDNDGDNVTEQILVRGFDFEKANPIYKFDEALVYGRLPFNEGEIILGESLMESFNIMMNSQISFVTPTGEVNSAYVVGAFDFKVANINNSWMITDIAYANELFSYDLDSVTGIEVQIPRPFDADVISQSLSLLPTFNQVTVENWKEQNETLLDGLNGQSTSSLMIQVFVLISVVLGIASILAITVLQKSRQIGILKAMGLKDYESALVFLFQGMILGIMGGIMGILIGSGLLFSFATFAVQSDGTPVVPIVIEPAFMIFSGSVAIFSSMIASLFSARKSMKLTPIEVIRNG